MFNYYPVYSNFIESRERYFPEYSTHTIHLYIDVKNTHKTAFLENYMSDVYSSALQSGKLDISTFTSIINYIIRIKRFFIQDMGFKNVKFFFFMDYGTTVYHKQILKQYKTNRTISTMTLSPKTIDGFLTNLKMNFELADKLFNLIDNIYFIRLNNLESDFVPHYLINKFKHINNIYHIIFSNDKDMFQSLLLNDKVFQYIKTNKGSKYPNILLRENGILNYLLKKPNENFQDLTKYIVLIMAMNGDDGDGIPGIKRIGYATAIKHLKTFIKYKIDIDDIIEHILLKKKFEYNESKNSDIMKAINIINDNIELLNKSYRLISYDQLLYYLDISTSTKPDKYNFNYPPNLGLKDTIINKIDSIIYNKKKYKYNFEQFKKILNSIDGVIAWDSCNIKYEELNEYFNIFNTF